jgi:hypothetical protein
VYSLVRIWDAFDKSCLPFTSNGLSRKNTDTQPEPGFKTTSALTEPQFNLTADNGHFSSTVSAAVSASAVTTELPFLDDNFAVVI